MNKYEEPGQYIIEVYPENNRFHLYYYDPKVPEDIPHYLEHILKACDELKPGFKLYVELRGHVKLRFNVNAIIRESQRITVDKGISKAAIHVPQGFLMEKMILNVTSKFSKQPISSFPSKEEALAWLDKE